jgi:hypothetical protein
MDHRVQAMTFTTSASLILCFSKIDAPERFSKPCLLIAGDGDEPDYSQIHLSDHAKSGEWRVALPPLLEKAERMRPRKEKAILEEGPPSSRVDENVPGAL